MSRARAIRARARGCVRCSFPGYGETVRLTEFHDLVAEQFGTVYGDSILVDHVVLSLGNRTAADAIEAGEDPKDVWRALCAEFDVPRSRW